jgi:hypothetical protein
LRWHVNERKVDFAIVKRIFKNEIYSDHRKPLSKVSVWSLPNQGSEIALTDQETPDLGGHNHERRFSALTLVRLYIL